MVGNVAGWSCRGPAIGSRAFYCHRNSLFLAWNSYSGEPTLNMPIVDHQLENDYYGTSPNAIAGSNLIRTPQAPPAPYSKKPDERHGGRT